MPADTGEAGEVAVVGVDDRAVLECEGRDGSIGDEVSGCMAIPGDGFEELPVFFAGIEDAHMGKCLPLFDASDCVIHCDTSAGDGGVCDQSKKRGGALDGYANGLRSITEDVVEVGPCGLVEARTSGVGVEQEVCVQDDHWRSRPSAMSRSCCMLPEVHSVGSDASNGRTLKGFDFMGVAA